MFALALACQPLASLADCVDGVREATAGELSFSARASASLAAAFPAPTVNAVRRDAPFNFKAPPRTGGGCRGTPEGGFGVSERAVYLYTFPRQEYDRVGAERRAVVERIGAIEALPPEKEAERKALEDQARAVYAQGPRRSRSDPPFTAEQQAESNRKTAEGNALMQKSREVTFEHVKSVRAQVEPLRAEVKRLETYPQEFVVALEMNVARPPAGDGEVVVFGAPAPARSAGFRVVNIVLSVRGPQGPARKALLDSIDTAWLQGLIGKPPPEAAVSEANAVRLAALPPAPVAAVPSTTLVAVPAAGAPAVVPRPSPQPAAPQASPAPSVPAPAPAPAPPVASAPAPAQPGAAPANCPPPSSGQAGQAANAGATLGGAVLGGGFGRSLGSMIGGAVGAVTGSATPGCPN
ncbi:MAG: hypothetical protein ACK51M_17875 [Burkholderiales bacterium]